MKKLLVAFLDKIAAEAAYQALGGIEVRRKIPLTERNNSVFSQTYVKSEIAAEKIPAEFG
ncbi:MAG: hypothetical protein A4E66_02088 [Syntrophus sp. PtaB.Bin001]|nr:MAG: hypothetical protein A4E66_02088 [Syntrophus sp. PtaB.Bin001]